MTTDNLIPAEATPQTALKPKKRGNIRRIIMLVFNILLVVPVLVSAYGGMVNPVDCVWPAMMAMTFPLWLALELIMLVVTLLISWRIALIPAATLALCAGAVWGLCPVNIPLHTTDGKSKDSFTVMSYNVYEFHDQEGQSPSWGNRTASNIINSGADVVCVLESYAIAANPRTGVTWAQADSANTIYPYSIRAQEGVSIYSKYPIRKIDSDILKGRYAYWLGGVVDINGHEVLVIAVHLESLGLTPEDRELYYNLTGGDASTNRIDGYKVIVNKVANAFINRSEQARQLAALIDKLGYDDVILAGDFNDISDCYAMRTLAKAGLHDAYRDAGIGPMITYNLQNFNFHIDQMMYRGNITPQNYVRGNSRSSDHYPIFARFVFD